MRRGCPVAVQAYPGNTGDPVTVQDQVEKLRQRFGLKRVVLVGDRGLLTETQIKHLKRYPGLGWISALRHEAIRQLVETQAVQPSLFDERHLAEIRTEAYPGERLVVCYNPMLAEYRRNKRQDLVAETEKKLARIAREVARRTKTPLLATQIALKVGRIKNRYKVAKHFELVIEDGRFEYARRTEAIAREAQLDGFYILRTSEPEDRLATPDVVRSYKNLTNVERAFRSLKTVDLQIRPIRHRAETRVRSHLFLCLLAYYVQWHLRRALAPLLFDDEDLEAHGARRDPVLKAEPSASAKRKKTKRETEDGLPLHSFKTLMAEMATRARHQCRTASDPDGPRLQRLTEPTTTQQRALELVKVFPSGQLVCFVSCPFRIKELSRLYVWNFGLGQGFGGSLANRSLSPIAVATHAQTAAEGPWLARDSLAAFVLRPGGRGPAQLECAARKCLLSARACPPPHHAELRLAPPARLPQHHRADFGLKMVPSPHFKKRAFSRPGNVDNLAGGELAALGGRLPSIARFRLPDDRGRSAIDPSFHRHDQITHIRNRVVNHDLGNGICASPCLP